MEQVALLPEGLAGPVLGWKEPQSGKDAAFLTDGEKIYQIVEVDRPHSSFFVGNYVVSNGRCRMATEVHPIFVVLQFVKSRGKEMIPEGEFFTGTPYEPVAEIVRPHLRSICGEMDMGDGAVLYYDDGKANEWLVGRTEKLMPYFRERSPESGDKFIIEMCFDVVRHFVDGKTAEQLRESLKTKYPGSFPPKTMEMVDTSLAEPETKKKKPGPKKKLTKPEGNMSISAFFKPAKQ